VEINLDLKKLDKLTKKIKDDLGKHYVKVGVLSAKNNRDNDDDSGMTNAKLAAVHEFGSRDGRIPERSFLRLTAEKRGDEMSDFIANNEKAIIEKVMKGQTKDIYKQLGAKWVSYINECFETEGFGTWPDLADSTYWMKLEQFEESYPDSKKEFNPKILQDTGQLERSIMYEVV